MSRVLLLLGLCVSLCMSINSGNVLAEETAIVTMKIDFGNGFEKRYTAIPWKKEMTIADALEFAAQHSQPLSYKKRGVSASTLLLEIDSVTNGTGDKYWIYEHNGREGEMSYALVKLADGDSILWRFGKYP
jgi:hypothetical protein